MSTVILYPQSGDKELCRLYGDDGDREMILREIDGWYGTPESRTEATPRKWGDGDHDVSESDIAYGARTARRTPTRWARCCRCSPTRHPKTWPCRPIRD